MAWSGEDFDGQGDLGGFAEDAGLLYDFAAREAWPPRREVFGDPRAGARATPPAPARDCADLVPDCRRLPPRRDNARENFCGGRCCGRRPAAWADGAPADAAPAGAEGFAPSWPRTGPTEAQLQYIKVGLLFIAVVLLGLTLVAAARCARRTEKTLAAVLGMLGGGALGA